MELQLGLALPSNPIKGFDLNSNVYEPKEMIGLDPWNRCLCLSSRNANEKKRSYCDAFELNLALPQTLPLSFWNNQPNEEDNPRNDGDGDSVVGWPPIKSWRKKLCYSGGGGAENDRTVGNGCSGGGGGGRGSNSTYVKVKMEGVGIARKVDLSLHHSYETLTYTLISMFGKCRENAKAYKLTYQDREGDWLLAGDVPWRTFIRSVQRLKLLRRSG